jgi:acetyltransferase
LKLFHTHTIKNRGPSKNLKIIIVFNKIGIYIVDEFILIDFQPFGVKMNRLNNFLKPASVAIIGASRKAGSLGRTFLESILKMNYRGEIYPVNPNADEISGIKCYPDLKSLPRRPALAVILLPGKFVIESVKTLAEYGVKDIMIVSAGFKEIGGEGIARENELKRLIELHNLNCMGPNCMGVFNTDPNVSFNGNFSPVLPNPGHTAFISQSGALGVAIMDLMKESDLGFSVFVSAGNKVDISENDVLEFLAEDKNTTVITMYLESIDDPPRFRQTAQKITPRKPIIMLKAGRTESGRKAASSHTGALANPEFIMDGFLHQCGVIRVETLRELFNTARAISSQPIPKGKQVAIVTNAGGPAIIAGDSIEKTGLSLSELSRATIEKLKTILPAEASLHNPVDMIASATAKIYRQVCEVVLEDKNVDSLLLIIVKPPVHTTAKKIIQELQDLISRQKKTILPILMAKQDQDSGKDIFRALGLPLYAYPEEAVQTLAQMWNYEKRRESNPETGFSPPASHRTDIQFNTNGQLPIEKLHRLLKDYHITAAPYILSEHVREIISFQRKIGSRIVLKIANEQIIHKSDNGLVKLGLNSPEMITDSVAEMTKTASSLLPRGVKPLFLAQRQLENGAEFVLGGKRDIQFGPIIMVGIGGIFIEALKDLSFRIAPVTINEARIMLSELRSQSILNGFRGNPPVDRDQFAHTIRQFSLLFAEHPEISEIDLNPLIWNNECGCAMAVDMRATIQAE